MVGVVGVETETAFWAVIDPEDGETYAVAVATDVVRPGYEDLYRWVPNFRQWVRDDQLYRDWHSFQGDQVNQFKAITADEALALVRGLPRFDGRRDKWILDEYGAVSDRLSLADVGLFWDRKRATADASLVEAVRNAPLGEWVPFRRFPPDGRAAARKWASEVRLGKRKRLAGLGPLEVRSVRLADGSTEVGVRRAASVVEAARGVAERAHGLQRDKAGRPYIGHPERVAARLEAEGRSPEVVAAGWLHDVLEDTTVTADDLRAAGLPAGTVAVVEAVTRRPGEPMEVYAARARSSAESLAVKLADLADNTDPARLALLDADERAYLTAKYERLGALIGAGRAVAGASAGKHPRI
ncbi:MAG: hypothetical protein LBK42_06450 [Propionibacteriaceae bacterium]|nr:hypothetical protein [Propionibacteriaceae bacterium]